MLQLLYHVPPLSPIVMIDQLAWILVLLPTGHVLPLSAILSNSLWVTYLPASLPIFDIIINLLSRGSQYWFFLDFPNHVDDLQPVFWQQFPTLWASEHPAMISFWSVHLFWWILHFQTCICHTKMYFQPSLSIPEKKSLKKKKSSLAEKRNLSILLLLLLMQLDIAALLLCFFFLLLSPPSVSTSTT